MGKLYQLTSMQIDLIPVALALGAVSVANYTDLKDRIIPDKMTYPLIVAGVAFYLALGIHNGEFLRALYGILGASLAFGIGYGMYLTGGWAGGDVKLFTALGALLPSYEPPHMAPPYSAAYPLFPLTLLFNSVIAAIPAILVYMAVSRAMGQGAFYESIKISELEEGMIPAETIYERDGRIERYDSGRFGFLSRIFGSPQWDRQITNPDRAAGISQEGVEVLQSLVREEKLEDRVKIKRGMPFAPALGAGAIIGIFYGGLYWRILTLLI